MFDMTLCRGKWVDPKPQNEIHVIQTKNSTGKNVTENCAAMCSSLHVYTECVINREGTVKKTKKKTCSGSLEDSIRKSRIYLFWTEYSSWGWTFVRPCQPQGGGEENCCFALYKHVYQGKKRGLFECKHTDEYMYNELFYKSFRYVTEWRQWSPSNNFFEFLIWILSSFFSLSLSFFYLNKRFEKNKRRIESGIGFSGLQVSSCLSRQRLCPPPLPAKMEGGNKFCLKAI